MEYKKILAIKLRELGDSAIWTASLNQMRSIFPNANIDILTLDGSRPLFKDSPIIHEQYYLSDRKPLGLIHMLWRLRKNKYDLVLGFNATTSLCRWSWLLKSKELVLHHHSWKYNPAQNTRQLLRPGNLENAFLRDGQLLEALGYAPQNMASKIHILPQELESMRALVKGQGFDLTRPIVCFVPGARAKTRRFPLDRWIEVWKNSKLKTTQTVIISDQELSREWNLPKVGAEVGIPVIDNLSLRQLIVLLSLCEVAVTMDSGPLHFAAAVGCRTLALFGPGCVGDWHPYQDSRHKVLRVSVPCRTLGPPTQESFQFCTLKECDHLSCLRQISPTSVIENIQSLLQQSPK